MEISFKGGNVKTIVKRIGLVVSLTILISISIYKFTSRDATIVHIQDQPSVDTQSPQVSTVPKDPFNEFLEKQSQQKEGQKTLTQSVQGVPNKDPFKEFLEKQNKDLSQSKVSPFESPK